MARSWPLLACIADFTGGPPGLAGGNGVDLLGPATPVGLRQWTTSRGRQYELGTVQAGTMTMDLTDPGELLNPVNSGSAWNSGGKSLLPYRRVQMCALWNTATRDQSGNILNGTNFPAGTFTTGFDPSFESGLGGWFGIAGSPVVATSTAQHFAGAQSMAVTYTGAADVAAVGIYHFPGRQHTLSLYVFVPATHTVTVTWQAPFYGSATIGTATSSTTGAWQRLTMTATPAGWSSVVSISCTSAYPATVFVDAYQLELGGSASAFTTSGPTIFKLYTGYIERYPQAWDLAGFRGRKPLQAVDALSPLSRTIISQSYASTVLADGPAVFVPYNDASFPQVVQQPKGGAPYTGYQAVGSNSASVSFGGDTFLDGSKAVTLSQQNADPLTSGDNTQVTRLGTRYGSLLMDPTAFTFELWVRWTAGQNWYGAGSLAAGESTTDPTLHDGPTTTFGFRTSSSHQSIYYKDSNGVIQFNTFFVVAGQQVFADGTWHHLVVSGTGANAWRATRDTVSTSGTYNSPTPPAMKIDNIYQYVNTFYGDTISTASFANAALYGVALTPAQIAAHYQRGIGYLGEKSGVRALRLLTQYWSTAVVTDTGVTSMATDFSYNGRGMLDVLQEIADTEAGLVWVDAAGLVHQDSRETRYTATTSTTPQFVFGENTAGGELPYEVLTYDYDPTYVYSQANITSGGTGTQLTPVVNAASQTAYGQRVLSKTLQTAVDWDAGQAASFYVQRYAKPAGAPGTTVPPRISGMTINPAANPNLWAAALTLDIGMRVTVKRRTSAGVTISGDYYVEQINHAASGDASTWTVAYQLSPVFVSQPWILGDAVKGVLGTTTVCVY
jgi:hypothetical protein